MPKKPTLEIQDTLQKLGENLGFISVSEEKLPSHSAYECYAPTYDVVWYLELEKHGFDLCGLEKLFKNDPVLFNRIKKLPFAGFEIEGASTSSKNQVGNFVNLHGGDFLFGFEIVNNKEANGEADTYRRGLKIKNYFSDTAENRNMFFFDNTYLQKSLQAFKHDPRDNAIHPSNESLPGYHSFGGDKTAIPMYDKIKPLIAGTGFFVRQDTEHKPLAYTIYQAMLKETASAIDENNANAEYARFFLRQHYYKDPESPKISSARSAQYSFYIPRIDLMMGFTAPKGFTEWLRALADSIGNDYAHFPLLYALKRKLIDEIYIPLVAIEFEGSLNKHMNGGIYNMSRNAYAGVLVTDKPAAAHVEFLKKEFGIKNVTSYCAGE